MITFRFRPVKALETVKWMLRTAGSDPAELFDFSTILKTCHFADKRAVNEIGRPVFGARYMALELGPVPVEIADMPKTI